MPTIELTKRDRCLIKVAASDTSASLEQLRVWVSLGAKLRLDEFSFGEDGSILLRATRDEGLESFDLNDAEYKLVTVVVNKSTCWKFGFAEDVIALADRLKRSE